MVVRGRFVVDGVEFELDRDAIKAKYREERDKRLRSDGAAQYVSIDGHFAHLLDDPFSSPVARDSVDECVEVAVIGGGFGGLLAAGYLRKSGVEDLRIIEKGGDFGGTWYWNRYPGAACDIESYIYLPMLEELDYLPSEKYSKAPEIFEHAKKLGRHFDLYKAALFHTVVTAMRWQEEENCWHIETNRGDVIRARFVVIANGSFERPKLPGIAGIGSFAGHTFHTSRWDYDYTGGTWRGGLTKLADKRVGIIGTGATAVQVIPHLGASAAELFVFQRTPSSIGVRNNQPTDASWERALRPGWQQRRMENFNNLVSISEVEEEEDLVADGWTDVLQRVLLFARRLRAEGMPTPDIAKLAEDADLRQMEMIRQRVSDTVKDVATAEALKPYYNQFCKRPCFHDEYLETFNRSNVRLVDTHGKGVERITPAGAVVDGIEHPLDLIVFATGFEFDGEVARRQGYDVIGRAGLSLSQKWAGGATTLHGMMVHGFPNLFLFGTIQSGATTNFTHSLGEQARHMNHIVRAARSLSSIRVEPTAAAERDWTAHCEAVAILRRKFFEECTPSYLNAEGDIRSKSARDAPYGAGSQQFFNLIENWRSKGEFAGLEFTAL